MPTINRREMIGSLVAGAAWGVAPAIAHLVEPELRQGRLRRIYLPALPL